MTGRPLALGTFVMLGIVASACSGQISLGDDGKNALKLSDVVPATSACEGATKHPNVCCKGEACYTWIDDPFRPCDFGYEPIADGSKCCTETTPATCTTTSRPLPTPGAPTSAPFCLRTAPNLQPVPELHVIGVYEPRPRGGAIEIKVGATAAPVNLVLATYESVRWTFALEPGAKVGQVLILSYKPDQPTSGLPDGTPVKVEQGFATAYGWEPAANTGGGSFRRMMEAIRARFGGTETSFQGTYAGSSFRVPFDDASLTASAHDGMPLSHYFFSQQQCAAACAPYSTPGGFWAPGEPPLANYVVENDGATARSTVQPGGAPWSFARSSKSARCGKHYFEVDVTKGGDPMQLAVLVSTGAGPARPLSAPESYNQLVSVAKSETIGVLLDLDDARVFYRTSTGWAEPGLFPGGKDDTRVVDPQTGAPGAKLDLWTYDNVIVGADLGAGGSATYRGAPPFTYPVPEGYAPGIE